MPVDSYWNLRVDRHDKVYVLTMQKSPENRINIQYAQEIIKALRDIEHELGPESEGCVIVKGNDEKFWCTGLDLDEVEANPHANADGFFPVPIDILWVLEGRFTDPCKATRNAPRLSFPNHSTNHWTYIWWRMSICAVS